MNDLSERDVHLTMPPQKYDPVLEALSHTPEVADFKRKSVRGGAAVMFSQCLSLTLQIVTTVVLARLLSPSDYGLQAMILSVTSFFSLFKDAGLSAASVQRETLTQQQISTLFWINVSIGGLLTILVAACGPILVLFFKDSRLLGITIASSTIFFFNSLVVQHRALLDRAMRFTTNVKIDVLSGTIGAVVAIVMAALGCGYWSLIVQNIVVPLITIFGICIAMPWIPGRPRWSPELRSMVRFGSTITLNSVVVYLAYNAEKILLGRYWGAAALGLYGRAYQLTNMPVQQLTNSATSVAFPMLSRLQDDPARLNRLYLKAHSLLISLVIPVVIVCAVFPNEVVRVLLGPKWDGSVPIVRLLSPAILVFALMNPFSWLLRSTGRVERSLKIALFLTPVMILGIASGLHYGPSGVALGYSGALAVLAWPLIIWSKYGTGITDADYWNCVKRPLIAGLVAGAAGWFFRFAYHNSLALLSLLAAEVTISFGVYTLVLLFAMGQKSMYVDLLGQIVNRNR
jgi:O-antigen/teichoic acid export membrane protein